jgi:hypothetical protein
MLFRYWFLAEPFDFVLENIAGGRVNQNELRIGLLNPMR